MDRTVCLRPQHSTLVLLFSRFVHVCCLPGSYKHLGLLPVPLKKVREGMDSWVRSQEPCIAGLTSVTGSVRPLEKPWRSLCLSILICQVGVGVGESQPDATYFTMLE